MGVAVISFVMTASAAGDAPSATHLSDPELYRHSGWVIAPIPVVPTLDLHVSCLSTLNCVAVDDTDNAVGSPNQATFFSSTDGGVAWSATGNFDDGIQSLSCFGGQFCMAAPFASDPQLVISSDGGHNWNAIAEPPFGSSALTPESVACAQRFCIVIGSDVNGHIPADVTDAALTTNLGKSWTLISLPPRMSSVQAMSCAASGQCFLVYDTSSHQFSDISTTADRGTTWRQVKKAPGFTSLGGFSCPSARSCIYLADQVLEMTSNGGRSWTSSPGPFSRRHDNNISAFSLACTTVTQCLIGGTSGSGSSSEQVVWVQGGQWSEPKVKTNLIGEDRSDAKQIGRDIEALSNSNSVASLDKAVIDLLSDFESDCAAANALSLHARGKEQVDIGAVGRAWSSLDDALFAESQSANAGRSTSVVGKMLDSDFHALFVAETLAGDSSATQVTDSPV
jgi:photosystem II stability/assembly factor-like uncharacterized protein